jgi:hypothetical protein
MNIFKNKKVIIRLSEKSDGNMRLSGKNSIENRKIFLQKCGLSDYKIVSAQLEHGSNVEIAKRRSPEIIKRADGLISKDRDVLLSVTVADCLPIYLFEPEKKAFGILHAGWKSLEKGIIQEAVDKMKQEFGVNPRNLLAGIGPGIDICHFEVKEDFQEKFADFPQFFTEKEGETFFDLKKLAEFLLVKQGILKQNIKVSRACVFCLGDKYFSFRRDSEKGREIRAMMAVIGIKA